MTTARKTILTEQRQRILDHLNEHGERSAKQLSAELKVPRKTLANYLGPMKQTSEIAARDEPTPQGYVVFYRALVRATTFGADTPLSEDAQALLSQFRILGREVHYGSNKERPHPSQGGQGAIRRVFGLQSSAEFI